MLQTLLAVPRQLLAMLFGRGKLSRVIHTNHQLEVFKDFWAKVMKNHYSESEQWASALWNYLHVA